MLNTEEFKKLTNYSENLNSGKKKIHRGPTDLDLHENNGGNFNGINSIRNGKSKNGKNNKSIKRISLFLFYFKFKTFL